MIYMSCVYYFLCYVLSDVRGWIARRHVSKLKKYLDLERRVKAAITIQKGTELTGSLSGGQW